MISIITIVFNANELFERTIKSIVSQTSKDFEYIVIDGGSTDGTVDTIKKYEEYITFWSSSQDKGISDAFNKGINKSSGNIIGILNAGDLFNSKTIEIVSNAFNKDVDYLYGNSIIRKERGQIDKTIIPARVKDFPYEGMPFQHSSLFIRREVFSHIGGYNTNFKTAMDFDLLIRIYAADYRGLHVDRVLSTYFRGGMSDENYIGGYIEVLCVSLLHNKNYFKILVYFIYGILRTSVRRFLL